MNLPPTVQSPSNTLIPPIGPCIWCWQRAYPNAPYPAHWSSSLCQLDKTLMLARRRGQVLEVQS